ncbi:MAG: hypothetical protein ABWZ02_10140 [Nakamurella sp.]
MSDSLAVTPSDLAAGGAAFASAAQPATACAQKAGEFASLVAATPGPGGGIGGMVMHLAEVVAQACRDVSADAVGHGTAVTAAGGVYAATDQLAASRFGGPAGLPGHPAI